MLNNKIISNKKTIFQILLIILCLSEIRADTKSTYNEAGDLVLESRKKIYNTQKLQKEEVNVSKLKLSEKASRMLIPLDQEQKH